MRKKIIQCDTCGKDITNDDLRYKFKEYRETYANYDDFEFKKWTRLDMCSDCFSKFIKFVNLRKE